MLGVFLAVEGQKGRHSRKARGVGEKVLDRHLCFGGAGRAVVFEDAHILKAWQVALDGVVEVEFGSLDEDHGGDGDDGLGHRVDADDRAVAELVGKGRRGGRGGEGSDDAAAAGDTDLHEWGGRVITIDLIIYIGLYAGQALGAQPFDESHWCMKYEYEYVQ